MMRRFRLGDRNAIAMSVVASVLSLIVGVPLIFVGCQTRPIAGLTTMVEPMKMTTMSTGSTPTFVSNLTVCLDTCRCDESKYEPICADGVEYLTPCHAGCRSVEYESLNDSASVKILSFSRCSCLPNASITAQPRACSHQCEHKLWTGIGISCVVLFIICVVQSPIYIGMFLSSIGMGLLSIFS